MEALGARLLWILEHVRDERGEKWSRRSLSLAAGLSQSHVGLLIRGDIGDQVSSDTLAGIARAARVDLNWLATGIGEPVPPELARPDPVPARAQAAELAREAGVYEAAILAVLAEPVPPQRVGQPTLWWADRMRQRALEMMAGQQPEPERAAPSRSGMVQVGKKRGR